MAVFRVHKTENYTVMSNHHLRNQDLSLQAKGLLSVILSLPSDWNYSIRGLAAICKEGERAVRTALNELKGHGYIVVTKHNPESGNGQFRYEYDIYETPIYQGFSEKPQVSQGGGVEGVEGEGVLGGTQLNIEELTGALSSSQVSQSTKEETLSGSRNEPPFEEILAYLNERTGKHFRNVDSTRKLIRARFREGYALEDFKRVIDVKCSQWIHDPRMVKYLQPSTLFSTKFEGYANEQPAAASVDYSSVLEGWQEERWGDANGS